MELHMIGIDLGKTVFHLVGLDLRGGVVVRRKFSRKQLLSSTRLCQSCDSLTGRGRVRKMRRPESWASLSDRPNHLALSDRREAGRWWHGRRLQG